MFVILSESFSGGGAERVLALLANSWTEFDGPVRIISLSKNNSYLDDGVPVEIFAQENIKYRRINRMGSIFKVATTIRRNATVLLCSYFLMFVMFPFAWMRGFHIVFRPSIDYGYIQNEIIERIGFFAGRILLIILNVALRSSKIIYQTPGIERSFSPVVGGRSNGRVVPNPVSMDKRSFPAYSKQTASLALDILLVGRLVPEKGFDRFLERLQTDGQPVRIHLCGEGPQRELLVALAAQKKFELIDYGFTNLRAAKISAALLVVPSRIEGFPNVVLEAALAGWPIVVSNEVSECIAGSPVASCCDIVNFEWPVPLAILRKIAFRQSTEASLESIFLTREAHSIKNFKSELFRLASETNLSQQ